MDSGSTVQQVEKAKESYCKRLASVSDVAMDTFKTLILRACPLSIQHPTIAILFAWWVAYLLCVWLFVVLATGVVLIIAVLSSSYLMLLLVANTRAQVD